MTTLLIIVVLACAAAIAYFAIRRSRSKQAQSTPQILPGPEAKQDEVPQPQEPESALFYVSGATEEPRTPPEDNPAGLAEGDARPGTHPEPVREVPLAALKDTPVIEQPTENAVPLEANPEPEIEPAAEPLPEKPSSSVKIPDSAKKFIEEGDTSAVALLEPAPADQTEDVDAPPGGPAAVPHENEVIPPASISPLSTQPEDETKIAAKIGEEPEAPYQDDEEAPAPASHTEPEAAEDIDGEAAKDAEPEEENITPGPATSRLRRPRRHRPAAQLPPRPAASSGEDRKPPEQGQRERALLIDVRIEPERGGNYRVSLLPRRGNGLPDEISTPEPRGPGNLVAFYEDWYQDVAPPDLGQLLRRGIEWEAKLDDGKRVQWTLRGRDLFVLIKSDSVSGYISAPSLVLAEEHVVLCVPELLPAVQEAIHATGSPAPGTPLGASEGLPAGWVGLTGVRPCTSVVRTAEGDILNALRPAAEAEVVASGGIRIGRTTWLSGYPPRLYVRGDITAAGEILIDGRPATLAEDGGYTAPGWNSVGEHQVWCRSTSMTYRIQEGAEEWPAWKSYAWSLGESASQHDVQRAAICGALVSPPDASRGHAGTVLVPAVNGLLVGAGPGEIYTCLMRRDLAAPYRTGTPPFHPVWALPLDALGCDRDRAVIMRVGEPRHVQPCGRHLSKRQKAQAKTWAAAILNACRKGLRTDPADPEAAPLWREYREHAQSIRRRPR